MPRKADLIKRLLSKLSWYHTKLTPFVARGPCASQSSLDQKTSNQAKLVLFSGDNCKDPVGSAAELTIGVNLRKSNRRGPRSGRCGFAA